MAKHMCCFFVFRTSHQVFFVAQHSSITFFAMTAPDMPLLQRLWRCFKYIGLRWTSESSISSQPQQKIQSKRHDCAGESNGTFSLNNEVILINNSFISRVSCGRFITRRLRISNPVRPKIRLVERKNWYIWILFFTSLEGLLCCCFLMIASLSFSEFTR